MLDSYAREIDYLRISVTDRCNLRCRYCMPEEGVESIGHSNVLTFEQIVRLIKVATKVGIRKIRFTGGEPLVRRDITRLIGEVAEIPYINDISITTNGVLFAEMAEGLKKAGLNRVNFSLDSLIPEKFTYITRLGKISDPLQGIKKAIELGFAPIKINTVVIKGFNDGEILDFVRIAQALPLHVRFIEFMPIGDLPFYRKERLFTMAEIKQIIESRYELLNCTAIQGNGSAKAYKIKGSMGTVGFISAMSSHFCADCNRIRMTVDGKLRGCLFDKKETSIKLALENGASDEKLAGIFSKVIREKPHQHHLSEGWGADNPRKMYQIGG